MGLNNPRVSCQFRRFDQSRLSHFWRSKLWNSQLPSSKFHSYRWWSLSFKHVDFAFELKISTSHVLYSWILNGWNVFDPTLELLSVWNEIDTMCYHHSSVFKQLLRPLRKRSEYFNLRQPSSLVMRNTSHPLTRRSSKARTWTPFGNDVSKSLISLITARLNSGPDGVGRACK
jgi:hypothetical protein